MTAQPARAAPAAAAAEVMEVTVRAQTLEMLEIMSSEHGGTREATDAALKRYIVRYTLSSDARDVTEARAQRDGDHSILLRQR